MAFNQNKKYEYPRDKGVLLNFRTKAPINASKIGDMSQASYIGRFAPSPTGPLHAGSVVAALASWLDARAHQGKWLVRMEDVDVLRCRQEHGETILQQLDALGLHPDSTVVWQSQRFHLYQEALLSLQQHAWAYPCSCSRRDVETLVAGQGGEVTRHHALVYPGTCRPPAQAMIQRPHAWRLNVHQLKTGQATSFNDRWMGFQTQQVGSEVGDFVLKRSDGCWAYQLAVVVDDADQGVTHVVRGADLLDNTARQQVLQQALGVPLPVYGHIPLVLDARGEKLSKQQGASAVATQTPQLAWQTLCQAAQHLNLKTEEQDLLDVPMPGAQWQQRLEGWVKLWRHRWL